MLAPYFSKKKLSFIINISMHVIKRETHKLYYKCIIKFLNLFFQI